MYKISILYFFSFSIRRLDIQMWRIDIRYRYLLIFFNLESNPFWRYWISVSRDYTTLPCLTIWHAHTVGVVQGVLLDGRGVGPRQDHPGGHHASDHLFQVFRWRKIICIIYFYIDLLSIQRGGGWVTTLLIISSNSSGIGKNIYFFLFYINLF